MMSSSSRREETVDEGMLLEEARASWIDHGFEQTDFTLEKMLLIWEQEDEAKLARTDRLGNNLR